jgi:signal transduction histidine kinase
VKGGTGGAREGAARRARAGAAARRRAAAADPLRDGQALLAAAVQQLREATGCELAAALARAADGRPAVAAAAYEGPPPDAPAEEIFRAAAALAGPCDLAEQANGELLALVRPRRAGAAAPVLRADGEPLAVLLVASPRAEPARPRTLALLGAAARRLAAPLAAAEAGARLARIDMEVRQIDRLATLGALAAELAHELRGPLVAVKTFLELLAERPGDPELREGFLSVARAEIARAERLLALVGEQPRERPAPARAALAPAAEAVAALVRHLPRAGEVVVETRLDPDLPEVAVGADALRQLLLNLALNAVDASPPGGRVCLAARRAEGGVELRVSDEGAGIPAEERARIFEPFHSTRAEGHAGLGLAICGRIVEEARGRIEVEDAPGRGAVFRVRLPAVG